MQSGAEMNVYTINEPAQNPEDYTREMADDLGCSRISDFEMMDCLRTLTWENIYDDSNIRCAVSNYNWII